MPDKIYIDSCALNRLADDHSQPRVRREAEAMVGVLDLIAAGQHFGPPALSCIWKFSACPTPFAGLAR